MAFTNDWDSDVGLIPLFPMTETVRYRTLVSSGESGKQRRRAKATGPRTWELVFDALTSTEADLIWQFYKDCNGAYDTFVWTNPENSTLYTVHFKSDELSKEYFQYNLHRLSFVFEEII